MLTDHQTIVLGLLKASIIAGNVNPTDLVKNPELTEDVIKMLGNVADIFLGVTSEILPNKPSKEVEIEMGEIDWGNNRPAYVRKIDE
ncbi:MAG: hypothetical protein ACRC78_12570 [Planktothrix sp.]